MKRLLLPSLFVIAMTTACKGEAPVGGVAGNANAGGETATGAGNGSRAGAAAAGSTTGDPTGGSGGDGAAIPVTGGRAAGGRSGSTDGGSSTTTGGTRTTGNAGTTAAGGERADAPIVRVSELDGGIDSLSDEDLYDTYTANYEYGEALWCVCNGGTSNQCISIIGSTPFAEQQCVSELTFPDPNGRSYVECRLQAEEDFVLCLAPDDASEALCATDCDEEYLATIEDCANLSDATWIEIGQECYDVEPFECDDGATVIPSFRTCDFESDCDDGTDESITTCPN